MIVAVARDAMQRRGDDNIREAYNHLRIMEMQSHDAEIRNIDQQSMDARLLLTGLRLNNDSDGQRMARAIMRSLIKEYDIKDCEYRDINLGDD